MESSAARGRSGGKSRVGDPYVWGAAGPVNLTAPAWSCGRTSKRVLTCPTTAAPSSRTPPRYSMSDLQPGDLVFPANPGEHVAMYIGNGDIVQAPYTGADVQIVPLSGFFVLATQVG